MQSQIDHKRNIFRASLRREFIESYQREIRMKYLMMVKQEKENRMKNNMMQNVEGILENLGQIEKMRGEEICINDNFEYFIEALNFVASKKGSINYAENSQSTIYNAYSQPRQHSQTQNYIPIGRSSNSLIAHNFSSRNVRISGVWSHKQNIYSSLNRILKKAICQSSGRLKYLIEKLLYLLQFPELMPLWEDLACINDEKVKNYCAKEFAMKLSKQTACFENANGYTQKKFNNFNIILDPDFVLDILMKFIVESPCIQFENVIELLPFVCYSLNIYKDPHNDTKQDSFPKVNKSCTILRNVLKENGHQKLNRLIEEGFENIFVYLIEETCRLFGSKNKKSSKKQQLMSMDEERMYQKSRGSFSPNKIQCGFIHMATKQDKYRALRKPMNLLTSTKINLVKLINRLFVVNQNAATYLYNKNSNYNLFMSLMGSFLNREYFCLDPRYSDMESESTKYKYIILCGSHRILFKSILTCIYVILMAGTTSGYSFSSDFLESGGIEFLSQSVTYEDTNHEFSREITSILLILDAENTFYNKLTSQNFRVLLQIEIDLLFNWTNSYAYQYSQMKRGGIPKMPILMQLPWCLHKLLKITRNSILISFARATQPQIFEQVSANLIYLSDYKQILQYLKKIQCSGKNQQTQIRIYATHILQICCDPKLFLQEHSAMQFNQNLYDNIQR